MTTWTAEARRLAKLTSPTTTTPAVTSHLGRGAVLVALGNRSTAKRFVTEFRKLCDELQENAVIAATVLADGRAAMLLEEFEDEDEGLAIYLTEAALRAQGVDTLELADTDPNYYDNLCDAAFQAQVFAKLIAA